MRGDAVSSFLGLMVQSRPSQGWCSCPEIPSLFKTSFVDDPRLRRSTSYRSASQRWRRIQRSNIPSSLSLLATREQSSKATNQLPIHTREPSNLCPRPLANLRWPRNHEAFRSRWRWVPGRPRPITLHRADIQTLNIWELRRSLFKI